MSEETSRRTEVLVGLFVLFGITVTAGVLFILGQKRHVFQERVRVYTEFSEVAGLVVGAPVQIAGVNAGIVSRIAFDRSRPQPRIRVDIEIARESLDLLRADSVARISSQGLLGDKLIDISPGVRSEPPVPPNGFLASSPPSDLDHLVAEAGQVMKKLNKVAEGAAAIAEELSSERTRTNISGSLAEIHRLLRATSQGRGLAHALFYDRRIPRNVDRIAEELDRLVQRVNLAVSKLQPIFEATDEQGRQLVNNLSRAALNVGTVAKQLERSQLVPNLTQASADIRQATGQVRRGEGTLGALVQDPTVYEQLVTILGGVARSRILRALIRYAISRDEGLKEGRRIVDELPR